MRELGEHLRNHAEDYRDAVHRHFFATVAESRQVFALSMKDTHPSLAPALAWVLENVEDGGVRGDVAKRLAQMGRDHRRHGFPPEVYPKFEASLVQGLTVLGLTPHQHDVATRTISSVCSIMRSAAQEADAAGTPPAHSAQVVAVDKPNRNTAVVRLESGMALDYRAGQHVPVTSQLTPGTWRPLTPAAPSDDSGQLTFHLALAGEASSMLAKAQPGDWWTLGMPAGEPPQLDSETTLISFGTGWAGARALLLDALGSTLPSGLEVYAVAPSPGEHYETEFQANLQALVPELTLRHIVRDSQDPWLLGARPLAAGFNPVVANEPMEPVLAAGTDRRFVLIGPADRIELARAALLDGGVSEEAITTDSWQRGHEWAASAAELDGWGDDWEAWAAWKKSQWA
ncbi:2-polyprenylphenol hydroxylase [Corynebacterium sp. HMSC062E11]|uniref:FAD-binding oxidoreductase n=1 Tax=Corynebacterium TaxID=1716 RepID=UPI0008A5562A|nr:MULTISPECIES: FAD-binding oxidoreductase [unclassified Corynebacterium]MDK6806352.1 FAD-binding oxidoreductase [Corynebacterium aurimucosum]NJJ83440.1 2-polyprenylphenol hydroxylase [Corynebacterium aurimucosum]OFK29043.1 2-polyprenylphenol hydroxylase [Corynebacterium sp. HMSC062E11]OFN18606.1 2-polyprenylphenol hydroxylase [Corynebacterium sp. HMSC055A01]OFP70739.1 2-polyprenylphenol hydroxylase [Corynebacterium sp. HMSC078C09]